ncbi:MAG: molybdenum cofactor synthesis domain-containing protein, partial [Cyanobacteria bacterium P01_D01_bin.71]
MAAAAFIPVPIAVLTVSDSRTEATDKSGQLLVERLQTAGHTLAEKMIVPDNIYQIRAVVSRWIADAGVQAIITTGGTGVTGRDGTPEAIAPLLDKELPGFGEIFRMVSYQEIKTSTVQSRALAGVANG